MNNMSITDVFEELSRTSSRLMVQNATRFINFTAETEEEKDVVYFVGEYHAYKRVFPNSYRKLGPDPETGIVSDPDNYQYVMSNAQAFLLKFKAPARVSLLVPGIVGWDEVKAIIATDRKSWKRLENRYYDMMSLQNHVFQAVHFAVPSQYYSAPEQ